MLARPPLSPERAPAIVPSGTRRVGPGRPARRLPEPPSGTSGRVGGAGTGTRLPSGSTATWSTSDCGTVEAVNTPYGLASAGGAVTWKPGYDASASSIGTRENARPTVSLSRSCTDRCSSALAASSVSASAWSVRASVHSRRSGRRAGQRLLDLGPDQLRLGRDVEPGEHERGRVAEAGQPHRARP